MFPLLDAPQRLQQFPELSLMPRQVLNKSFGKTRDKNSQFIQQHLVQRFISGFNSVTYSPLLSYLFTRESTLVCANR